MSASEAAQIQELLSRLMTRLGSDPAIATEVARAEREFFQANPTARTEDPAAGFRFQEWFLLERESERLGAVPVDCMPMELEEREALEDSLVGAFEVQGSTAAEYTILDLQDDCIHDLQRIEGVDFADGDVLIGRLYDGSLDVFIASPALCAQRHGRGLAAAFRKDVRSLELDRRLTQAEIEHLLFRGRGHGAGGGAAEDQVPLERLEAELEACLHRGGAEHLPATAISAALKDAVRPGPVMNPLLEKIAFDTEVDIQAVQQLMLQIWAAQQRRQSPQAPGAEHDVEKKGLYVPEIRYGDLDDDDPSGTDASERSTADPGDATRPKTPASPRSRRVTTGADDADEEPGLGAELSQRLAEGLANAEDMAQVFADVERMLGETPDPEGFRPDAVNLSGAPEEFEATDAEIDGDLQPLITEYLWENNADQDGPVLGELYQTLAEAAVPQLDLESVSSADLMRLLLQPYLAAAPGRRGAAVGRVFAVLSRFYAWVEDAHQLPVGPALAAVQAELMDQVPRLDQAGLRLARGPIENPADAVAKDVVRVYAVTDEWVEVSRDEEDELVRLADSGGLREIVAEGDLLLGSLEVARDGTGTFAGMVVALPAAAMVLLG